ncbi:MAG: DUF3313 family protein [Pseudomonadales bacterium]
MMWKKLISAVVIVGSVGLAANFAHAEAEGLSQFSKPLAVAYLRPFTDFRTYDGILVQPLDITETRLIPAPWAEGGTKPHAWDISKKNAKFLQNQYGAAMQEQLQEKGGYTLATEPGEGTLEFSVELVSLTPWAKQGEKVITKGSGEITIRVELRDSLSGDILGIFEGDQDVGTDYQENTEFSVDQNVNRLFGAWGEKLVGILNEEKAKREAEKEAVKTQALKKMDEATSK